MKYIVCRNFEWLYPDKTEYKTASEGASFSALAGGYAAFQIFLSEVSSDGVEVFCEGAELYEEVAIPVEANPGFESLSEHFPERTAPFRVYDCLKNYDGRIMPENGIAAVYIAIPVPVSADKVEGTVRLADGKDELSVPYSIIVKGKLPRETLQIVMDIGLWNIWKYHGLKNADEYLELETKYLSMLRRQHQNRLYVHACVSGRRHVLHGDGYAEFDRYVEKALSMGFTSFHLGGVGFRRSWQAGDILVEGMDSRSEEAKEYLTKTLSSLRDHLREKGWLSGKMFSIGIADEPNDLNAEAYKELAATVRSIIPELKLYDAISNAPIDGALDIWIPRSDEYENNREVFEKRRVEGGEIWQYVCLFPREGGYVNRFMDIPLLSTRYIYWGNYLYDLDGYLHWTVNSYQNDTDPFMTSCPEHRNADSVSILPPGDDKLIYPGTDGPWMSIRLENQRESAEEYEMLRIIAAKNKKSADDLCKRGLRRFNDAEYNPQVFAELLEDILDEYEKASLN